VARMRRQHISGIIGKTKRKRRRGIIRRGWENGNKIGLTFILLMWTFGRATDNASKWETGFNSVV
jgi:hypothetical protein